ncbi:unnamed protein product [Rodentolepis nana]|uniref:SET domain-containing protein n=1 Tax=Rodentolepis nana TaxID=102285 RepID=A0A0R3U0D3_RODNA|nr:unnamed protein product [Rodentolepis nana]
MRQITPGKGNAIHDEFIAVLQNATQRKGGDEKLIKDFRKLTNDFDRVCFLLKIIENPSKGRGAKCLGLPGRGEIDTLVIPKSDVITLRCLQWCSTKIDKKEYKKALSAVNRAYFCADSKNAKFKVLQTRCQLFLEMEYYRECLRDAISALKNDIAKLKNELNDLSNYKEKDICHHPEPAESLIENSGKINKMEKLEQRNDSFESPFQLVSAKEGVLRPKNTNSNRGWSLEATRNVSIGEVLLTEKPYASILGRAYTKYCYCCYKRCLNIRPCEGCTIVGFCSKKCADQAMNPNRSLSDGGSGRHIYDCRGILPCLTVCHNTDIPRPGQNFSHLAYTCAANTPPDVLLNYLYSIDPVKRGRRHQCFTNDFDARGDPPAVFDPFDYSSLEWLDARHNNELFWNFAINAIFLTYCLWLSGYPMKWFDEAKREFYKKPSQVDRPDYLPASWIVASMMYYLKVAYLNALDYTEYLESPSAELNSNRNWLGLCIYPTISLINHSCNPNACLVSTANGGAFLYALRPMEKNEEVTICYQYYYFSRSSSLRIGTIFTRYLFDCNCEACSDPWDTGHETEILKCPSCGGEFLILEDKCSHCNDESGYVLFQRIIHEKIPFIWNCLALESCGMESVVEALSLLKEVQDLILSPSPTVSCATSLCMQVIDRAMGIRTVDNTITDQLTYSTEFGIACDSDDPESDTHSPNNCEVFRLSFLNMLLRATFQTNAI